MAAAPRPRSIRAFAAERRSLCRPLRFPAAPSVMPALLTRLTAWAKSAIARLKQRSWKIWAVVALISYVVLEAIRARISDASTLLLGYAWRALAYLASQPMGIGGLAVVTFLIVLMAVSWIETRPRRSVPDKAPAALSENERRVVQDIRTIWQRFGVLAVSQLSSILRDTHYDLKQREYWAELLEPVHVALEASRATFETALEPSQRVGIHPIRDRFNGMYADYVRAMKWVAVLQAKGQLALGSRPDERLAVWRQSHRDMVERFRDLNEDPAHRGSLHIYLNFISDPVFREFVFEAEMSPDWLNLIRESQGPQERT